MAVTLETSWKQILTFTETTDGYLGNIRQTLYAKYSRSTTQLNNLQSTISWELRTKVENGLTSAYYGYNKAYSITSKETSESSNTTRYSANINQGNITTTEKVLASGEWTQNHSSNGTCNVKINYSGYCYSVLKTGSVDVTLPNIVVNPTLTINSSTDMTTSGSTINYTLGSTNGRSTKIQYSTNGSTWTDWKTKTADGTYSETLPSLLSSFPNTYTPTVYFRAITGNYSSGSKSKTITISSSIKPSISSVVINPVNTYTVLTNNNLFVKNLTKPRITTTASAYANGGATLKQYDLTALGGYNSNVSKTNVGNNYTYGTAFQKSGSYTATVKVIDTRGGNVSKTSSAITVIDYYNPSITSVSVQRCTSNGTLSDTGTYCKLSITYKIAPITSGSTSYNTKSLKYKIGSGSWTTISISSYNTTITQVIGGSLSTNSSYQISVQLQDLTTTVTQVVTLPTSFVLVSKHTGGKGIAFGKIAESDDFRSGLRMYDENDHRINGVNARPSTINLSPTSEKEYGSIRYDIGGSSTSGMPSQDGFVVTFYWDNAGRWDTQLYLPNNDAPTTATPKYRCKANNSDWGNWHSLGEKEGITVGMTDNKNFQVTTTYSAIKITLDTTIYKKSSASGMFVFEDNGVTIKRTGRYLLSGNIMVSSSDTNQTLLGRIYKISGSSNTAVSEGYIPVPKNGFFTIALTPIIVSLASGDKIFLGIGGSRTGEISVAGGKRFTYLTITEL